MEETIAFCGLICSECPAYLATQNDDDIQRKKTAEMWSKEFNANISPEEINCDGCISDERVFKHCNVCEIRLCGRERGILNCGFCNEYACGKLIDFFKAVPDAKKVLDDGRARS
jgi:hypothetical protein